ncbi:MAG: histidinol-phosphate transaminase [Phycisphaerales bacterium]|nr:histidinol-phosphate transaminase [Hyphomonadaceae bacterium]
MSPQPKPGILDIASYTPGKAKAPGFAAPLKLSANENCLGCSEAARAAYLAAASELHLYPDANTSRLRAAIAEKFALDPQRLVFGAGSDEIFAIAAQAYLSEGDNIVQPQYAFAAWAIAARAAGGLVKSAPEADYTVDVDAMLSLVDERTRLVFIANPANPTGTWLHFTEIERLHAGLPPHILLVLDGAYAECAAGVAGFLDGMDWAENKNNVLVTRTFSKMYGLASLRIGWAYAPRPVAEALSRIRLPFSVPRAGEAAAVAALADDAFLQLSVAHVAEQRPRLAQALAALGARTLPSAANFVTAQFPHAVLTAADIEARLAQRGILVRHLKTYAMPDWLRVSVGREAEIDALIGALTDILESADRA